MYSPTWLLKLDPLPALGGVYACLHLADLPDLRGETSVLYLESASTVMDGVHPQ